MPSPQVCVVTSTYNRADLIPRLIEGLTSQTFRDAEFVIVDNGSEDRTPETLANKIEGIERIRAVRIEDNRGPARARNVGWRSSAAPLIAFTDDDCVPDPDWLVELVGAAEEADVVQGRTVPLEIPGRQAGWFDRSLHLTAWTGRFQTCNLLVRRSVLEAQGGFDEEFRIAMGEDMDLGLRAVAAGATSAFADRAVVRHHIWPGDFLEFLRSRHRVAHMVQLMKVNPSARRVLRGGFLLRGTHALALALGPLLVSAAVSANPLAWLLPAGILVGWPALNSFRTRRRPHPWHHRFAFSLLQFIGYCYETSLVLAASVRYRTFVL